MTTPNSRVRADSRLTFLWASVTTTCTIAAVADGLISIRKRATSIVAYDSTDFETAPPDDRPDYSASIELAPKPRVWTVFAAIVALVGIILIAQILAVALLISIYVEQGMNPKRVLEELPARLATPVGFFTLGAFTQIAIGMTAWLLARRSLTPTKIRLGLMRARVPLWTYPILMLGSLLPLAVGVAMAMELTLGIPADDPIQSLFTGIKTTNAIPFLIFISVLPGVCEELFWRGYVQRRLMARWSPWVAIVLTSLFFALFHVTPRTLLDLHTAPHAVLNALVLNAFIVGLWLGVLAHKTDSVWPAVACHAFVKAAWYSYEVGQRLFGIPEELPRNVLVGGSALIVVCFCTSVGLMLIKRKS